MGPSSKMKVILRQGENLNTDMHTELMPCEDKGRDWSDASTRNTKCWPEMTRNSGRLFNLYAEYIMRNAGLEEAQARIKIARRNINNLRYADDISLMVESEEELNES